VSIERSDTLSDEFQRLDEAREQKKKALTSYFSFLAQTMQQIRKDGPLIQGFDELNRVFLAWKHHQALATPPQGTLGEMEEALRQTFVDRFMVFDNVLFVNREGDVFFSARKNALIGQNLFRGALAQRPLSRSLMSNSEVRIVDFGFLHEEEPAAFFIHPVRRDQVVLGWCAFQFDTRRLETLFARPVDLGRTGEVFLVNEQCTMMTPSALLKDNSPLFLSLSEENILAKFEEKQGHKKVIDYRGREAITSFEVCQIMDLNWLLVAKMDWAEALTRQYLRRPHVFFQQLRRRVQDRPLQLTSQPFLPEGTEVKLDQVKRLGNRGGLNTFGASTCTVVLVTFPGSFSYLAHISAYDALYGGRQTDLLANVFDRIRKFEMPDEQLRLLKCFVITPKVQFSQNVVNTLVEEGLFLSQIVIAKNHKADFANVTYQAETGQILVEWCLRGSGERTREVIEDVPSLAVFFEDILFPKP
jgi:hypothetical protein